MDPVSPVLGVLELLAGLGVLPVHDEVLCGVEHVSEGIEPTAGRATWAISANCPLSARVGNIPASSSTAHHSTAPGRDHRSQKPPRLRLILGSARMITRIDSDCQRPSAIAPCGGLRTMHPSTSHPCSLTGSRAQVPTEYWVKYHRSPASPGSPGRALYDNVDRQPQRLSHAMPRPGPQALMPYRTNQLRAFTLPGTGLGSELATGAAARASSDVSRRPDPDRLSVSLDMTPPHSL